MASKTMRTVLIVLFCAYIALFSALYILLPAETFSEKEKRTLASFPETSLETVFNGQFEQGLETWMSDHVPFRDGFVGMNAVYELASGRNGLGGVIYAGENRLFAAPETLDEAAVSTKFDRINAFARASGLPVDVMLIPTSGHMHDAQLPAHAPYPDARLAALAEAQLDDGIGFIWPEERFAGMPDAQLYYNTDHHLTSRGSYEACRLYAEHLGLPMPEISDYDIETAEGFYGSMYAKAGLWAVDGEPVEIWRSRNLGPVQVRFDDGETYDSMFFPDHLSEMDKYPVFLDGNHPLVTIETGREEGESLLIIRDSFGHCFAPFTADHFRRITLVDLRYYRKPITDLAAAVEADRVLVLYGVDTFITDTNFAWLQ